MVDVLVKNAHIMTMDADRRCYQDGAIAIDQGRIVAVGDSNVVTREQRAKKVLDAAGKAVLPGFINAHTHLSEKFLVGLSDDLDLYSWLSKQVYPALLSSRPDECYWMAMLGCIEMIRSGVTCFVDTFGQLGEKRILGKVSDAVTDCGMRAQVSREIEEITEVSAGLALEDTISTMRELRSRGNDRIRVRLAPGITTTISEPLLSEVREIAQRENLGVNMHLAETVSEVRESKRRYGDTPVRYANRIGLLGPNTIAAHCIWVDSDEIELLARTGTNVAYNPVSNMKLADGVAPVWRMLEEGVNVSLGTDGPASNDNLDIFSCMKTGSYLQKVHYLDAAKLPSHKMLEMVTINGAIALGEERNLGSIEIGKRADLTILDLDSPNTTPVLEIWQM